jgi:biopolymer transport protein ExbD
MGMSVSTGQGIKAEPNVVPMIDVMLVLLIIFMVVTPAITSGFTAVPPEGVNLKEHPEEDWDHVLGIDREGMFYIDKKPIAEDTLERHLRSLYETREIDKILYLKAHRDIAYERVLKAIDISSKAGVIVMGAITDQTPGTKSSVAGDVIVDRVNAAKAKQ